MINKFLNTLLILIFAIPSIFAQETEEVISVASFIDNKVSALPVDIISAKEFKNLRVSSVAELSKYLSIASGSHFQTNALDGVDQGMAAITLRGLDHASTLVLINKKRQTHAGTPSNDGEGYIDVSIIPEIALEQIEILKDGTKNTKGKIWNICLVIISCDKPPSKSNILEENFLEGGLKLSLWEIK